MTALADRVAASRVTITRASIVRLGIIAVCAGIAVGVAIAQGFETPLPVLALGTIIGLTYGLLAVGLVLVYRSNRIINFAHGEVGAFAAAVFGLLAVRYGLHYYLVLPLALAIGAGTSALAEVGVVRRLRNAPRLMSIVATLGVGQFLVLLGLVVNAQASAGTLFPEPPGLPVFSLGDVGELRITQAYSGMLIFGPAVVVLVAMFLKYSRFGLAIRSAAANPEAARMAGIPTARMSTMAWAIAGALSALTAILTQPTRGFTSGESFGPELLLRALAGAVLARMTSLPLALTAGIGLGIVEQLLLWNRPQAGVVEVALFVIILVTLLVQQQRGGRDEEKSSWAAVQALRPVPEALQRLWTVRNLGLLAGAAAVVVAALLPLVVSHSVAVTLVSIMAFAVVGLSVGIVTGLGGQLSLGQFAVAGVGAWASYEVSSRIGHFELAFVYAGLAGALVSLVIGLPALRVRGLFLTVTTLSFALVVPQFVLQQELFLGEGVDPGRPILAGLPLDTGKLYYWFALPIAVLVTLLARNVWRGGFGRLLIAVRDNEDAARAFTVRAAVVKTQGFLLAGFVAGVGGALYGHALSRLSAGTYATSASIDVVTMTVIGGISLLAGPIIGALFVIGVPAFVPLDAAGLAASRLGALLIILYLPSGLGGLVEPLRDRIVKALGRRAGIDVDAAYAVDAGEVTTSLGEDAGVARPRQSPIQPVERLRPPGALLLEATDLVKSFGGVHAVQGLSLEVRVGETVGLIGPNGAGKTTAFELLGGFTKLDSGAVFFDGQDVTRLGPEARAQLGLIRSFQDAALFPTMTVGEAVELSLERVSPTRFFGSLVGLPGGRREKERHAAELVGYMGLDRYRSKQIRELSTGTRRITEITCLIALQPTLLLLDEPSSGIAQRETEALGTLLRDLKRELDVTLLIIEHDIPLIMGLADRIIAMANGQMIASGTPQMVRNDPAVVEAYLGGSIAAIERSGGAAPAAPPSTATSLRDVEGLGPAKERALLAHFGDVEAVRMASAEDLVEVPGISVELARRIHEHLRSRSEVG